MSCMSSSKTTAREREVYRYLHPSELLHTAPHANGPVKTSSSDPCLTAFAQLGALRLKARRGIIVLSTGTFEFILAESGPQLSLQQDDDENDKLWIGVGPRKRVEQGLGPTILSIFTEKSAPDYVFVGDMTKDERFCKAEPVVTSPHLRTLACVPIRSMLHGVIIGSYTVVDDQPRESLNEGDVQFMLDMATTVTDYLEAGRLKMVRDRSESMVKAIGLFVEGKGSLRDWWLDKGHKQQHTALKKRGAGTTTLESRADVEFGVQEVGDYFTANGLNDLRGGNHRASLATSPGSSTTPSQADADVRDTRPPVPTSDTVYSVSDETTPITRVSRSWEDRNSSVTTFDTVTDATPDPERHPAVSFSLPPDMEPESIRQGDPHELQNALLSGDIRKVFARASNLIREAIGVEGVVYYDASVGSFGGSSEKNVMEERAPGAFQAENNITTSEDELTRKSSDSDGKKISHSSESTKHCNVLGFSTRTRSNLHGHRAPEELRKLPETILRKLLKRYPHGKVFNFDGDGLLSSSESDGLSSTTPRARSNPGETYAPKSRKRLSREQEAAAILSIVPGARSVFWFPLWDQNRERWFAGSLVWSTSTTRTLCPVEDITYLAAFGNSTMAEISRLSAQVLSKMKTDFISSISHELRSPLHGVLASVEFLQETEMTEQQKDMVDNIHASGKVLLDTINHVLDFSKVNKRTKNNKRSSRRSRKSKEGRQNGDEIIETADICIISEEVIESIYSGQRISKKAFGSSAEHKRHDSNDTSEVPVSVIVDIAWRQNWTFEIDRGAWRRILMNLFSNAMKYTAAGFVKVSLDIEDDSSPRHKASLTSNLVLKVKDSGRGIHSEFLNHQLFRPFAQEDSLASGAGLGLSIVKAIVQEMGGKVSFVSDPGTGTEATVKLPLVQSVMPKKFDERKLVDEVRQACTGKRVGLVGFDRYPDLKDEPTGILDVEAETAMLLKESVKDMFKNWVDIEITSVPHPDIMIVMEAGLGEESLSTVLEEHSHGQGEKKRAAIVLTDRHRSGAKLDAYKHFQIFYLQQPHGPHKICKCLHQAFCRSDGEPSDEKLAHSRHTSASTATGLVSPTSDTHDFATQAATSQTDNDAIPGTQFGPPPRPQLWVHPSERLQLRSVPSLDHTVSHSPLSPDCQPATNDSPPIHAPQSPPDAFNDKKEDKQGLRVLLVEDNEINLKLLIATMRKLKLEHSTAMNGLEALNAYKECLGRFDVIFMDISMPIMSGIESTRHIRRFEKENDLAPVALIALTGAANASTRQEAFSSGVDLFLTKPVAMKALRGMLEDLERAGRGVLTI